MGDLAYPLVSDLKREIVQKYNVLTPDGVALRGLFIIDKEVLHAILVYLPPCHPVAERALTYSFPDEQCSLCHAAGGRVDW